MSAVVTTYFGTRTNADPETGLMPGLTRARSSSFTGEMYGAEQLFEAMAVEVIALEQRLNEFKLDA